jgi:ABC-type nitrate/sulfonate/bicarbonate transport system ATPase subunit
MLDVIQRERAQKLLRLQLADTLGVGVCVVSHDLLDLSRIADRVLILTSRPSRVSTLIELDRTSEFSTRSSILWRAAQNILGTPL